MKIGQEQICSKCGALFIRKNKNKRCRTCLREYLKQFRHRNPKTKVCTECGASLSPKFRGLVCEPCKYKNYNKLEYMRDWREAHREKDRRNSREYRQRNLEKVRKRGMEHGWRLKGIKDFTYADFERLLKAQEGLCAICKRPNPGKRKLGVDHNHATGQARELLCARCNHVVGVLEGCSVYEACLRYLVKWNGAVDYRI